MFGKLEISTVLAFGSYVNERLKSLTLHYLTCTQVVHQAIKDKQVAKGKAYTMKNLINTRYLTTERFKSAYVVLCIARHYL